MQNIITKEKIEQLERFNSLIQVMDKMSNNMQLLANRVVTLEQQLNVALKAIERMDNDKR